MLVRETIMGLPEKGAFCRNDNSRGRYLAMSLIALPPSSMFDIVYFRVICYFPLVYPVSAERAFVFVCNHQVINTVC